MRDLIKNYSSNIAKNLIKSYKFDLKFKSRKNQMESINVLSKQWGKRTGMFSGIFNSNKLKCERKLPIKLDHTCRLIKTQLKKYYICIPQIINKDKYKDKDKDNTDVEDHTNKKDYGMDENQYSCIKTNTKTKLISLDPGIRTFQTGYDPEGLLVNISPGDIGHLVRLQKWQRKLQGKIKKLKPNQTKQMKKALIRSGERIKNLVDECHKKTALWLCKNYNTVLIPRLNFHGFKTTSTSSQTRSKLSVWSHCNFVDRLINK